MALEHFHRRVIAGAPGALERVRAAGVRRIVTTDSVPALAEPGVEVVPVAPLFARALWA